MSNEQTTIRDKERELQKALSQKSDEELRTIVSEEDLYDENFLRAVREELTGRVAGIRRQKNAEDFRREEEQERREEEERARREEEERTRLAVERAARAERIAAANRRLLRRIAVIVPCVLAVTAVIVFFVWNNSFPRLLERGHAAVEQGDETKAKKLFLRAAGKEKEGGIAAYELYKLLDDNSRLKEAADRGHGEAAMVYGKQLLKKENWTLAAKYLEKSYSYNSQRDYLLGCAYFASGERDKAKKSWEQATSRGYPLAPIRLGDWYLCYGNVQDFSKALEYYRSGPQDFPGVADKIKVLEDLQKQASRSGWGEGFTSESWEGGKFRFYGESNSSWEQKSVLRGIYSNQDSHRFYGKFSSSKILLSGQGIISYRDGSIYVGNLKVVTKGNNYDVYCSGQGTISSPFGKTKSGQWKANNLIGKYSETDLFGDKITH